ncbi:MAG TPA: trypsin-like peptidase domain-containing protein [Thermoanaerobaculia bacterium]|nr:trypsin-like peptidase domain-containing protein [Thermoanaerobaculia bacterium]
MHLSGPQLKALRAAVIEAFPSVDDFDQMMKDRLDKTIYDYTAPKKRQHMYAAVLEEANAAEWIAELVSAARAERPQNSALRRVAEELGLATATESDDALQKIIEETNARLDIHTWLARLSAIEPTVCRIVADDPPHSKPLGTGFLVGPSVILTNQHVIAGIKDSTRLRAQFDHYVLTDGSTQAGVFVPMADAWLIDSTPPSALDKVVHPIEQEPAADELDYAFLRLNRPFGNEPVGPVSPDADVAKRGWVDLMKPAPDPPVNGPAFIVQHPSGGPMKLALSTRAIVGFSPNRRRVRYRTNTLGGSSGSPVFDQEWRILALHHSGDPEWVKLPEYNEGIPISTITAQLRPEVAKQLTE